MKSEFQVVVLAAGKGSRITELTSRKPKCLLPIGNKPMVYYPLKLLEKSGFREVFLVVLDTAESEVKSALEETDLSIAINYRQISSSDDWGTADSLRYISRDITSDFIVVSCDLLTTFDVKKVLDFHRKNDAALTALYFHPSNDVQFTTPGPKSKNKTEKDLIGIDPVTNRLVFLASASDYEEVLSLKKKLLFKHGDIRIHTNLIDAHFFVVKKWVVKYLTQEKNLSTIKGELLPNTLKKELSKANKLQNVNKEPSESTAIQEFSAEQADIDIFSLAKSRDFDTVARSMSSYNDHNGDLYPVYMNDYIRSYAYIVDENLVIRNNTLRDYCKSNQMVTKHWKSIIEKDSLKIFPKPESNLTGVEKDTCFIDPSIELGSRTFVKSSSIGQNSIIGNHVKISDCIIMNNVVIKDNCTLSNCIVCDHVTIQANCKITDSVIGSQHSVPENSSIANEVLSEMENLMEV
ncbi:translation initiation factor eIF2B subunit gamma [Planococcus citri]|uniref:translation initiation factor eIF2B subunit gamma n=1 Tax=Planococcus citri TaxID=170843 RepID=UPI0031F917E7